MFAGLWFSPVYMIFFGCCFGDGGLSGFLLLFFASLNLFGVLIFVF